MAPRKREKVAGERWSVEEGEADLKVADISREWGVETTKGNLL